MTARALTPEEWREAVLQEAHCIDDELVPVVRSGSLHPAAAETLHRWLVDLRDAACSGDLAEVRRLADLCRQKIKQEEEWAREGNGGGCNGC